jgi:hypothetical protein
VAKEGSDHPGAVQHEKNDGKGKGDLRRLPPSRPGNDRRGLILYTCIWILVLAGRFVFCRGWEGAPLALLDVWRI